MVVLKIFPTWRKFQPDRSVLWRGAFIISIPVVCLFASIFAIAGLRSLALAALKQKEQSQQTIMETEQLLTALINAETGVRGYVVTKRPEFLQPYSEARRGLPQSIEVLRTKEQSTPAQRQQFQKIQTLAQQQITLLEQILKISDAPGATTVGSPVLTSPLLKEKSNMDRLRQEIAEFAKQEQGFQRDRQAAVSQWRDLTTAVQWGALVIGVLASAGAWYLFNQLDQELDEQASRLRETNVYLQAVFAHVVDGILILNERGYIHSSNAAAVEIFGYQPDELIGKHLQRLIAESFTDDSGRMMRSLLGKNQDKLRLQQETVGRRKGGNTFPMEFAVSEMRLENEHLFIAIVRDISDRKQSQETLLKQAQLLDLANDTIMVRDLNDTIRYWNQGAQRLYGFESQDAVGQCADLLLKTEFPQPRQEIDEVLFNDGHWRGELVNSRRDGTRVVVASSVTMQWDETGEPVAYLEIHQDITERKQAEAAWRKSEELYRVLAQNLPNGAVFLFDQDLRYSIAEGTALASFALTSEMLVGKTIWETLPPSTIQILEPIYRDALAGKRTVREIVFSECLYCVHVLPVFNEKGEVFSGMVMMQDITESKKSEEVLRSRADELARLMAVLAQTTASLEKRNEELDKFAYIVSHDLKAPLRAIANLSQWLEEDLEDHLTTDTRHQMNLLRGRVYRMEALINGLLQYSRVGRIRAELELVDVEALLVDVIDSLAPPPEFTVKVMPGMPTLIAERLPLEQVFANLISNGIKHNHQPNGQVVISVAEKTDFYEFSVSDNGPGIAPEFHEKVFVIFQTLEARDTVENTGVGLAIVKKIIEDRGGTISLKSEEGKGTTFQFTWLKQLQD